MIVEANLGVNKANCCITREAKLKVVLDTDVIRHTLSLTFTNASTKEFWGGRYKAWVRIYANAREQTGFWVEVPEGETKTYSTEFTAPHSISSPRSSNLSLVLLVQKQSGIKEFPLTVQVERKDRDRDDAKKIKVIIQRDQSFVL